jgi:SAM-dependent methyltransferase
MGATGAVRIETAPDEKRTNTDYRWRDDSKHHRARELGLMDAATAPATGGGVDPEFLNELHHLQYGRPWAIGRYIFEFLVEAGCRPGHRVLDFGCGALRLGIHAIRYLDAGNYFGVDSHLRSLEAAVTYELPLHGLEDKRPRLLWDGDYNLDYFGVQFDWVVDFSTTVRIRKRDVPRAFTAIAGVLHPDGRVLTSPAPKVPVGSFAEWGLRVVRDDLVQECPMLLGGKSTNRWWELASRDG